MKKIILLYFFIWLKISAQQVTSIGIIDNLSLSNSTVCACGNVTVSFNFTLTNANYSDAFKIYYKTNGVYTELFQLSLFAIMKSDKTVDSNFDTSYHYNWKVPCNILKGASALNYLVTLKDDKFQALIVKDCTVGIEEHSADEERVVYYNFNGQIVEPKQGELLIKQVGYKRTKVLIKN